MPPEFLSEEWVIIYGGLVLTLLVVFIETAFPIGVIIPGGEILLFISGLLGGTRWIEVNILFIVIPITLVSFMADLTGYSFGLKKGSKLFEKTQGRFIKKKHIRRTLKYNQKYGILALIFSRFFPVIRTFNPIINGAREFDFTKFFIFSGVGALVYVNALVLLGYFVGRKFPLLKNDIKYIIAAVVLFILITPIVYLIRKNIKARSEREN